MKKLVSVIIPVYNEAQNLPAVYERVKRVTAPLDQYHFEMILIDNGSTDASPQICKDFVSRDNNWRYVRFSRNFGIEASFFAGASYSQGDALIYLFSDLQDPPEAIPTMLQKWEEGFDVVYGILTKRADNIIIKTWGSHIAYKLIFFLSDITIPINATDFRLLSRPVIDVLKSCKERNRYMRGLTHWAGFKQVGFEFERSPRKHGNSNNSIWWSIKYALNAMINFSNKPLRLAGLVGFLTMSLSIVGTVIYILHLILTKFFGFTYISPPPPGWTTIILLVLFFGGLQTFFLGIIGEYIAQIQNETKFRPAWIKAETKGFKDS